MRRYLRPSRPDIESETAHTALCDIHIVGVCRISSLKEFGFSGIHSLTAAGLLLAVTKVTLVKLCDCCGHSCRTVQIVMENFTVRR